MAQDHHPFILKDELEVKGQKLKQCSLHIIYCSFSKQFTFIYVAEDCINLEPDPQTTVIGPINDRKKP